MARAATRGGWNLHRAIMSRWKATGLDERFWNAAEVKTSGYRNYPALHDTEAKPKPPGPYCVFEVGDTTRAGGSSGTNATTFKQYEDVPVTFTVHAETKTIAARLIADVARAFDPEGENDWTVDGGDSIVMITRNGDQGMYEGDDAYAWILRYTLTVDATYNVPASEG